MPLNEAAHYRAAGEPLAANPYLANTEADDRYVRACMAQKGFPTGEINVAGELVYLYPGPAKPAKRKTRKREGSRAMLAPGQCVRRWSVQASVLLLLARTPAGVTIPELEKSGLSQSPRKCMDLMREKGLATAVHTPLKTTRYVISDKGRKQLAFLGEAL